LTLRIGTRGSRLALWQADAVAAALRSNGYATEQVIIKTTGDRSQERPVPGDDSKRQFVKEIEDALLAGDIDIAVHSAKDLPVDLPDTLTIAACLPREDPRDALVLPHGTPAGDLDATLARLPREARIGTGSVRRSGQLKPIVPQATFAPVRGNVDTRVRKLDAGEFDALILACAGLRRLGLDERITTAVPLDRCVPAPGQGIVATETRVDDDGARRALMRIHDDDAGYSLTAERTLVVALGGGCDLPLGAIAVHSEGTLELHAAVASLDGSRILRHTMKGPASAAADLGHRVADALTRAGARELL